MKRLLRGDDLSHRSTVGACIEGHMLASGGNGKLVRTGSDEGRLVQARHLRCNAQHISVMAIPRLLFCSKKIP